MRVTREIVEASLDNTLTETDCEGFDGVERGKVRDSFCKGGRRAMVVSDRLSAFDRVLCDVPFKGQVLNQIAAFWFDETRDIVANHLISVPDPNIMLVHECEQLPLEFVVRGYITGVTRTSAWYNYERGVRDFCGNRLPEGLRKDQRFARPILTPTTKHEIHDRPISRDEAIAEGLIDADTFDRAADICFALYERGVERAARRGLILVDTKYELGRLGGELVVSDEIHTPDSSRFWFADTYEDLFARGLAQRKLDKEYVREWLAARGFTGDGPAPAIPDEVRIEAALIYVRVYEIITGLDFEVHPGPIGPRVREALGRLAG